MKHRKIVFCLALTIVGGLCGGTAMAQERADDTIAVADFLSIWKEAESSDAQYASAVATRHAGLEKLPQGRAGLLPTASLTAERVRTTAETDFRTNPVISTGKRNFYTNTWTVSLTQPLFRWQNFVTYHQSKLQVAQSEAQFAQAQQDLILRVAQAYFDVLLAQDSLVLARAQKNAISEQLEQAKRNFEVGTATITDTHEAQARFDLGTAQELAAENELEIKRHGLRQLIGHEPAALKRLRTDVQLTRPEPDSMDQWVTSAEESNFLVQVAQAGYEIAMQEVQRQRAGHYPTLDLVATHGNTNAGGTTTSGTGFETKSSMIGLQLTIPLFSGGLTTSRTNEAVALREKARADYENTRSTAALNARQFYLGVTSGLAQVRAFEQALVSSKSALDSNRLGYEVGVRINIDVLNAQQQVFSTQRDLAKARYDTILAQLRLKAISAGLGEEDVQRINALLE